MVSTHGIARIGAGVALVFAVAACNPFAGTGQQQAQPVGAAAPATAQTQPVWQDPKAPGAPMQRGAGTGAGAQWDNDDDFDT